MHSVSVQYKNTQEYTMNTQQKYTISEATAFLGFKSRSTINKRTKEQGSKALSYEIDENGNKVISILELERVFPDKVKAALKKNKDTENTGTEYSTKIHRNTPKNTANTKVLEAELEVLHERVRGRDAQIDLLERQLTKSDERITDLSDKLSQAQSTLDRQTYLLEDKNKKEEESESIIVSPQDDAQSANDNLGDRVGDNTQKAIRGKNFAVFGVAVVVVFLAVFLGVVFAPQIQGQFNGAGVATLSPAAGE